MEVAKPGSQIDHLLRQTRMHHMQLSSMADMKANMLLTMSSIVITLSVPRVIDAELRWVFVVLIAFCLLTIILATYAAMPKLALFSKKPPPPDLENPSFNLLFFGDFARLDYETYANAMERVMNDPSSTYEAQVREVYVLGQYLAQKKYKYLSMAYSAFMAGIFCSGILVIITMAVS